MLFCHPTLHILPSHTVQQRGGYACQNYTMRGKLTSLGVLAGIVVGVLVGIGMLGVVVVAAVLVCRKHETSGLANGLSMASASL